MGRRNTTARKLRNPYNSLILNEMIDLTVSIGTLNNYDGLEDCLDSLFYQNAPDLQYKVFVAFNGPQDEQRVETLKTRFQQVQFRRYENRLGWCRVHNLNMGKMPSRFHLIMDDDAVLHKDVLFRTVKFLEEHPSVGLVGCKTLNPNGTVQLPFGLFFNLKTEFLNAVNLAGFWPHHLYENSSTWQEVDWITGTFMMVRTEVLAQVGGFDEYFYTLGGEPDWCYRIRKTGSKVAYVPDVEIIHTGNEYVNVKIKKVSSLLRYHINRFYFFHKHYHRMVFHALRPIMFLGAFVRLVKYALLWVFSAERRTESEPMVKANLKILKICFSQKPHSLPEELARQNALASENL